jgi:hypothetical protein
MKLSEHLDLAEITRSDSAKRNGISNMPTEEHIANFKLLAEAIFEPIRNHFRVPIIISSGYRSKELNAAIGGSATSQHSKGEAVDIDMHGTPHGVTNKMIFDYAKEKLPFDQIIWEGGTDKEPDWVHISYSSTGKQRGQALRAFKVNGKMQYTEYK